VITTGGDAGARRGKVLAGTTALARDLANCPPAHLTAVRMAELAEELGAQRGLTVEVFDRDALLELGCGGLLAVNGGSAEPPRMIKLSYRPDGAARHLGLVGKGIMYDSGGISLKPADPIHAMMKNDMSGAGAILAAMCALRDLGCPTAVTGWLMCTDNMPSGTALKMGGVIGSDQDVVDRLIAAGAHVDERLWQMPLEHSYRADIDSPLADIRNLGGANGGAIHAALFLYEFVDGVPWAHLDIAGVADVEKPGGWRTRGCSGFGARLLADFAVGFGS